MQFNKDNLSPAKIAEDLQQSVSELDEFAGWQDYFAGGAGQTIIELVAGSQAIKNHFNLMRVRESSLVHAKMDSSITELAINKGVYRPPAKGFIVRLSFDSIMSGTIQYGELIGSYKDFNTYSLERKEIVIGANTLDITFGHIVENTIETTSDENFHIIDVDFDDIFVGDHFHQLIVNDDMVHLTDTQMNLYNVNLTNSVINMVSANKSKLVFGDGVIGKLSKRGDVVKYRTFLFDKSVTQKYDHSKLNLNEADMFHISDFEVIRRATGYLDKEVLRRVAIRASIDGRWVQTVDYESGLMRHFGEYMSDIIVEDEYPTEFITYLPKSGMMTDGLKAEINNMIEDKRGNAVDVRQTFIDPDDEDNFIDLKFDMTYFGVDSDEAISDIIDDYIHTMTGKLANGDIFVVGADMAVELTRELESGKMYCDLDQKYVLENLKFIRKLTINFVRE